MIRLLVACTAVLALSAAPVCAELPTLIPRKVLFGNPVKVAPQISPDGKTLSYIAPDDKDVLQVWVQPLGTDKARQVTADSGIDALTHAIEGYTAVDFDELDAPDGDPVAYEGRHPLGECLAEKAISLIGAAGYATTIIDGGGDGPVVLCNSLEGAGTVIQGFTVRNGHSAQHGGGLFMGLASPTISTPPVRGGSTRYASGPMARTGATRRPPAIRRARCGRCFTRASKKVSRRRLHGAAWASGTTRLRFARPGAIGLRIA